MNTSIIEKSQSVEGDPDVDAWTNRTACRVHPSRSAPAAVPELFESAVRRQRSLTRGQTHHAGHEPRRERVLDETFEGNRSVVARPHSRGIMLMLGLLSAVGLALYLTAVSHGSSATSYEIAILEGTEAVDVHSTTVRMGLAEQGLTLDKFVKLSDDGPDTFWVARSVEGNICLVANHVAGPGDWVSGASCAPPNILETNAITLSIAAGESGTWGALLPDGFLEGSASQESAAVNARVLASNLVVPMNREEWGEQFETSIVRSDGNSISIYVPPSVATTSEVGR